MNKRSYRYFTIQKMLKMASKLNGCIEFPHFGARYPDAACIDGYLWDLDSGDSDGLTKGGEDPCPCCNTRAYINDMLDNEVGVNRIHAHLQFIFSRYSRAGEEVSIKLN